MQEIGLYQGILEKFAEKQINAKSGGIITIEITR